MTTSVLGAVLSGGRSRHFGSDKAAALLNGRPLRDHVVEALASQVAPVVVGGRRPASRPASSTPPSITR